MTARLRSRISGITFLIVTFFVDMPRASEHADAAFVRNPPTLHLIWNDAYDLFPKTGFDQMREEVERQFAENGLVVRVHPAKNGHSRDAFPEPAVNAVLLPTEAKSWNLKRDVMAAAIGGRRKMRSIFISHPGVKRTLGHDDERLTPRRISELSRGMGRIVAHELVHVLVPECKHARDGLMAKKLTRKVLLGDTIVLDARSRRHLCAMIKALRARTNALRAQVAAGS